MASAAVGHPLRPPTVALDADHSTPLQRALRLSAAASELMVSDSADLRWLGECLSKYLHLGGSLESALGVQVGRGGAHSAPHRVLARRFLRDRMESVAAEAGPLLKSRVAAVKKALDDDGALVRVFHSMGIEPPTSDPQIARILRGK